MARRSYDQYCTMATALDIVGERWTLLIVRELMLGPRRFKDLLEGLPGIGRNLLSARMRHLQAEGLVTRSRPSGPSGAQAYELTADGQALGPVMAELGRWGAGRLGAPEPRHFFRAGWAMFPLSYMANAEATRGLHEVYEFRIGDDVFHLRVDDGAVVPRTGSAPSSPELVVTVDPDTFLELMGGTLLPMAAVSEGRVSIVGPPESMVRLLALWPVEGDSPGGS